MKQGRKIRRVLLVEANDMAKWVGGGVPHEVHIPPIGLMYLAAYARQAVPGLEIRILESSLDCPTDEAFLRQLEEFRPDLVGIRSIAFFLEELQRIARLARESSDAVVVGGGPAVQAYRRKLFDEVPQLDLAVKGEGERTFSRILAGEPPAGIPGVLYRDGAPVIENADSGEIRDIDSIPFPAYDLVDVAAYERHLSYAYNHRRQGVLLTGRGCPYRCTFCFSHWQALRLRSAQNVFEEIRHLAERFDIKDFYIIDDIFNVQVKRSLELFERILSSGLKVRLYFANGLRADITTEQFVDKAIEAGAVWFTYAIESANQEIQELIRKRVDLERAGRIIAYTQRQGVVVNISTMFGFPTETRERAQETLDWLGRMPKPSVLPYHFCLRFFPGCEINRQALEAGFDARRLEPTGRFSYNDLPMGTPTLPRAEMYRILLEYHGRFGLNNTAALSQAVGTLKSVGYSDAELIDMYSVLKRKAIRSVGEIAAAN